VSTHVGIDLVAHDEVRESLARHPERWPRRICTPGELEDCAAAPRGPVARLAGRFAAKEAALKILVADDEAVPWTAIEIHRDPVDRSLGIELHGPAAALASSRGLAGLRVDIAAAAGHAVAVVLARGGGVPGDRTSSKRPSRKADHDMNPTVHEEIRRVLDAHARLTVSAASLAPDADLYQAGMTSHASVNVMLALEDAFDVEFPDRMLKRSVFESVANIAAAMQELTEQAA
jgi:phosphopantetheine--protein transferase-like protein